MQLQPPGEVGIFEQQCLKVEVLDEFEEDHWLVWHGLGECGT